MLQFNKEAPSPILIGISTLSALATHIASSHLQGTAIASKIREINNIYRTQEKYYDIVKKTIYSKFI